MSAIAPALDALTARIAALTAKHGDRVDALALNITDRAGLLTLHPPGLESPNRACRLFRVADGWMVLNLAREEDRDLIPAWLSCDFGDAPWALIAAHAPRHRRATLIERAIMLGLPAGGVGEIVRETPQAPLIQMAAGAAKARRTLKVVDLSALWAGPMCGAILAAMGAAVTKIESVRRPDPTRDATPEFFRRLNGRKSDLRLDLSTPGDQERLREAIRGADVFITSARPRAFAGLGVDPGAVFADNPGLVWVAVTGYGWSGAAGVRVAFGDDAAAAGGVVRWNASGEPRFLGDALADPVTGLAAAEGALRALDQGGGCLVDVSLAASAAGAAALCNLSRTP
jgi:hypothetical protein